MNAQSKEIDPTTPVDVVLTATGSWAPHQLAELAREHDLVVTEDGYDVPSLFPHGGRGHKMPCTLIIGTAVPYSIARRFVDKWREVARDLGRNSSLLILRDGRPLRHVAIMT
ncbi:hypothetical protein ACQEU6_07735 [Spirillospora sp. CA-108201]